MKNAANAIGAQNTSKVLIVDDSESMRDVIAFTLQDDGYQTTQAANGEEALKLASSEQFDLVITDINMPEMDGITLTGQLRASPNYKYVPILILTTETCMEKKEDGKKAGATGWIIKPFVPENLLKTIKKVCT